MYTPQQIITQFVMFPKLKIASMSSFQKSKLKKVMKVEEYLNSVMMIFLVYNGLQGTLIY